MKWPGPILDSWRLVRRIVRGLFKHHAFDHAATMSFYFFLGLIPLIVCAGLVAGALAKSQGAEELMEPLYHAMPRAGAELFRKILHEVADSDAGTVAPVSVLGFLWLTSNGVHNLMDVFELLLGVKQRSWWRQRLYSVLWLAAACIVVTFALWVMLQVNGIMTGVSSTQHVPLVLERVRGAFALGWRQLGSLAIFATLSCSGVALFYRISVVHPRGVHRRVWPGTFVAHGLWAIVSWAFGAYVQSAHYAMFYGSLATVAVILLWLYLTSIALLVGAEVNAILEGVRAPDSDPRLPKSTRPPPPV